MFEVPEKYRAPDKPVAAVGWATYSGARTSCDGCLVNIAKGESRHFSEPAQYVRTTPEGRGYYCYRHGHAQRTMDELAGLTSKGKGSR